MRIRWSGLLAVLLVIIGCGIFKPDNSRVLVYGTFIGSISEQVDGFRIVARRAINLQRRTDISEALIWADESFRADHHARGDSTTIITTFTLPPDEYQIKLQKVYAPTSSGGEWGYGGLGSSDSWANISLVAGSNLTVRLRGLLDRLH